MNQQQPSEQNNNGQDKDNGQNTVKNNIGESNIQNTSTTIGNDKPKKSRNDNGKYIELLSKKNSDTEFKYLSNDQILKLENDGYIVIDNYIENQLKQQQQETKEKETKLEEEKETNIQLLNQDETIKECLQLYKDKKLKEANMGRGDGKWLDKSIRSDLIIWLNKETNTDLQSNRLPYIAALLDNIHENIKNDLNRCVAFDSQKTQTQLAIYPKGGRYVKHCDSFVGSNSRRLTCIYYLNRDWKENDNGQLRIYLNNQSISDDDDKQPPQYKDIDPIGDRLLIFLSEYMDHEVLESNAETRLALTTWLY